MPVHAASISMGACGGVPNGTGCPLLRTHSPPTIKDWVTGQPTLIPLAGPANRQGRIAADTIMGK